MSFDSTALLNPYMSSNLESWILKHLKENQIQFAVQKYLLAPYMQICRKQQNAFIQYLKSESLT